MGLEQVIDLFFDLIPLWVVLVLWMIAVFLSIFTWVFVSSWKVAGSKWFDRTVRALAIIVVIPWAAIIIAIPLIPTILLFVPGEHHTAFTSATPLIGGIIILSLQGIYLRNMIQDNLKDHNMSLMDYLRYRRRELAKEKIRKEEVRKRTDKLLEVLSLSKTTSAKEGWEGTEAKVLTEAKETGQEVPREWQEHEARRAIATPGIRGEPGATGMIAHLKFETRLFYLIIIWTVLQASVITTAVYTFLDNTQLVIIVTTISWLITVFILGLVTHPDAHELGPIVFLSVFLTFQTHAIVAYFLDLYPNVTLLDHIFYAIQFYVVLILVIALGGIGTAYLGQLTFQLYVSGISTGTRGFISIILAIVILVEYITLVGTLAIYFPYNDVKVGIVAFLVAASITIAFSSPTTREKTLIPLTTIPATTFLVILDIISPIFFIWAILAIGGLVVIVFLMDQTEFGRPWKELDSTLLIRGILFIITGFLTTYIMATTIWEVAFSSILVMFLLVSFATGYFLSPPKEEAVLQGLIGVVAAFLLISMLDIIPMHPDLERGGIGWIPLPASLFSGLLVIAGSIFRENVVPIASDGHRLACKAEKIIDDWLVGNTIIHEPYPVITDERFGKIRLSFRILKCNNDKNSNVFLQYWPKFKNDKQVSKYQEFAVVRKDLQLEVIELFDGDLDYLDDRLQSLSRFSLNQR